MSLARQPVIHGLLICSFLVAGCNRQPAAQANGGGAPAPVVVAKATRQVVPVVMNSVGSVEPIRTASVRAQVSGILQKIDFQEGQEVKGGDLLFEIDPRTFQNALTQAKANLDKAQVALRNATAETSRYRTLYETGNLSAEQFQTVEDTESSARASVGAAEADVANDTLQVEYCSVRAPIAGLTGSVGAHEGDLVKSGDAVLVVINQLSPIYATFSVPQQDLSRINQYRTQGTIAVAANAPGQSGRPEEGELSFIDNAIDQPTGTIKLKATFPNTYRRLWPGQFANILITLASPQALVVPASAVQTGQKGEFVFVVQGDNKAEMRNVTVERKADDFAVITDGLQEGDTVITDGQLRVIPGRAVAIKDPSTPAAAPAESRAGTAAKQVKQKSKS